MKYLSLVLFFSIFGFHFSQAQSPTLTGLKRTFSDNSAWAISTSTGSITLKNLLSDGSEWAATTDGKTYHIKRTYSDDSEWQVTETGTSLHQAYKGENTEWRVQRGRQSVNIRDRYKDGAQWDGDAFAMTRKFSDGSDWSMKDQAKAQPLDVKLLLVFAVLHSQLSR